MSNSDARTTPLLDRALRSTVATRPTPPLPTPLLDRLDSGSGAGAKGVTHHAHS